MATTYDKGTRLGDVPEFDRSIHVKFYCPAHPHTVWTSKDPERSRWFTATDSPTPHEFCWHDQKCRFPLSDYILADDYTPFAPSRPRGWD